MKTTEIQTQQLVALSQFGREDFSGFMSRAKILFDLLHGEVIPEPLELRSPAITLDFREQPLSEGVQPRPPMRSPAPGSLRDSVYRVLETHGASLSRKQIIEAVAAMRHVEVSENLKNSVGEVLRNQHDPRIRRIQTGIYTLEQTA